MNDQVIDLRILNENDEKFNIEDYYVLLERRKLQFYSQGVNPITIEKLEDSLTILDRVLQDLKSSNDETKIHTYRESSITLSVWYN